MIPESLGTMAAHIVVDSSGVDTGIREANQKLEGFSKNLRSRGLSNIVIGLISVGLPFRKAINSAAAFGREMNFVSTMLEDANKWMPTFSSGITKMSVELGEGTDTLAKGLYDILSASIPPEKAMGLLEASVRSARAGLTDTAVSVDAMTTVLNAYSLDASRAADISDWFFSVIKRGKLTYPELASDIGMVATTASLAGLSLEEMGAAIATMTRAGIRSNMAVTALNNILVNFLSPIKDSAEYAKSLGWELNTATIQAEGLRGVFERIKDLPPEAISRLFPNIRALRGVLPALQNLEGFDYDLKVMANRAGEADKAFQKMTQGMGHALQKIGSIFTAIWVGVGESFVPALKWLGERAVAASDSILSLVRSLNWVFLGLGTVAAAFILGGTGILIFNAASMLVTASLAAFAGIVSALVGTLGLLLSPIGLVVTALALVGAAVIYVVGEGDGFISKLKSVAQMIWSGLLPAFRAIRDTAAAVWGYLRPIWEQMKTTAFAVFRAIGEFVVDTWRVIRWAFEVGAGYVWTVWTGVWGLLGPYAKATLTWVQDFVVSSLDFIAFSFKNWELVTKMSLLSWQLFIVTAFNVVIHQITQLPIYLGWLLDNWQDILKTMADAFSSFTVNLATNLTNLGTAIWNWIKGGDWDFEWTPLLQGFESSLKQMPAIAERELGALEKDLQKQLGEVETQLGEAWVKHAAKKAVEEAALPVREAAQEAEKVAKEANKAAVVAEPQATGMVKPALAKLAEKGTAEAYTAIVGQGDWAATTARNTGEQVKEQKRGNKLLEAIAARQLPVVDLGLD